MPYLIAVTVLWSFSFSLIGVYLSGHVDAYISVFSRIFLATLIFIPFLRVGKVPVKTAMALMGIGSVQLGFMYLFYYHSFLLLTVPEVLLFTVFTPIYVTLLHDLFKKQFSLWYLVTAAVAVLGAIIIKYNTVNPNFLLGFGVVQGANICFAFGQVAYKYILEKSPVKLSQHHIFAWFYLGALAVATVAMLLLADFNKMPETGLQWGILAWLGTVASGLGYFFWNKGACIVNAGALAVMNNALVPAGLVVNIVIWNKDVDLLRLALGGGVILFSLWLNERLIKPRVSSN